MDSAGYVMDDRAIAQWAAALSPAERRVLLVALRLWLAGEPPVTEAYSAAQRLYRGLLSSPYVAPTS